LQLLSPCYVCVESAVKQLPNINQASLFIVVAVVILLFSVVFLVLYIVVFGCAFRCPLILIPLCSIYPRLFTTYINNYLMTFTI